MFTDIPIVTISRLSTKKYVQVEGESNSSKIWFECITQQYLPELVCIQNSHPLSNAKKAGR